MALYILLFPTEQQLHAFVDLLGGTYTEINVRTLTLVCECTANDIEVAISKFSAKLVDAVTEGSK